MTINLLQFMISVDYIKQGTKEVHVKIFDQFSTRSEADEYYLFVKKLPNVIGLSFDKSEDNHWVPITSPIVRNELGEWVTAG